LQDNVCYYIQPQANHDAAACHDCCVICAIEIFPMSRQLLFHDAIAKPHACLPAVPSLIKVMTCKPCQIIFHDNMAEDADASQAEVVGITPLLPRLKRRAPLFIEVAQIKCA
jgi:hypothetical protein